MNYFVAVGTTGLWCTKCATGLNYLVFHRVRCHQIRSDLDLTSKVGEGCYHEWNPALLPCNPLRREGRNGWGGGRALSNFKFTARNKTPSIKLGIVCRPYARWQRMNLVDRASGTFSNYSLHCGKSILFRDIRLQWHWLQWQFAYSDTFGKSHVPRKCYTYRDRLKCWYVVARSLFLLLLTCSAWPCLGPA